MYKYDKQKWMAASESDDVVIIRYGPDAELNPFLRKGAIYDKLVKRDFSSITCSDARPFASGVYPTAMGKYEKPGVSASVAAWDSTNCI